MLQGNTIFAGDSITVGLKPFVKVNGDKREIAKGGQSATQLLTMLQAAGDLSTFQNMVVLIGTNDIASGRSAATIFKTINDIWGLAKTQGLRIFAMTIPPARNYVGFISDFENINTKRKTINALIKASSLPSQVVDLDVLLGSPGDTDKLAASFDSGDHIHPRKDSMGALLTPILAVDLAPLPIVAADSFPWTTAFILVGVGIGGTIFLARKDPYGIATQASRTVHGITTQASRTVHNLLNPLIHKFH